VRTIESELINYMEGRTPKQADIRKSLEQISINNKELAGGSHD